MVKKIAFAFGALALAVASAANSYVVTLYQPTVVAGTELKPGYCKVEIRNDKVVLSQGKKSVESPVKIESSASRFDTNSFKYAGNNIEELSLGGTHTRLVFEKPAADTVARGQ